MRGAAEAIGVSVLAKAPIPGYVKTRLVPLLGALAAAQLQEGLTENAVRTAIRSGVGPVTLWCAPDATSASFRELQRRYPIHLRTQPALDLGQRMARCISDRLVQRGEIVIGTDCPCLTPADLVDAANALLEGAEAVLAPAEDGGYGLIGMRETFPEVFAGVAWSTPLVMEQTRSRLASTGRRWTELPTVWDVDRPEDYQRLLARGAAEE